MQDPRYLYPQPPFTPQPQPFPGSSAAMSPEPDHGEDTYRGSGRLAGRRALITGGDSGIGRAIAIAYAREGADVALSYLPEEQADAETTAEWVRQAGQRVLLLPGDIEPAQQCRDFVTATVDAFGGIDILINTPPSPRDAPPSRRWTTRSGNGPSQSTSTASSTPPKPRRP